MRQVLVLGSLANGKSTLINTVAGGNHVHVEEKYSGETNQEASKWEVNSSDLDAHL
jgi:nicotinamide riboside kinase